MDPRSSEAALGDRRHPIKVVVRRTGLSADVLRAWERRYAVIEPDRSTSGRRLYSDEDIERLRLLRLVTLAGRNIGSVSRLSTAELERLARDDETEATRVPAVEPAPADPEVTGLLEECRRAVADLDAAGLEGAMGRAAVMLGASRLLEGIFVPLLIDIGERWTTGELSVAHEHMASAVTRQVLGGLLRAAPVGGAGPLAVFGTPSGERHEFGALMAAATAAAEGWRVIYLGADLPIDDLAAAALRHRARMVALSLVSGERSPVLAGELANLRRRLPADTALVVGGRGARLYDDTLKAAGAVHVDDLAGLRDFLHRSR
jgi:DNA-binding transcriptional MerR regulator/methylmalonyl-CoA mutase cobalamin-binding subunit